MPHARGPGHRPRSDRAENRAQILAAYVGLVSSGTRPTVDDVARAARVGRTTVYRHFGDVAGLRIAAFLEALEEVNRVIADVARRPGAPADEILAEVVAASLEAMERFALASLVWPLDDPAPNRQFDRLLVPLTSLLEARQRSGDLTGDLPARFLAEAFVVLVEAAASKLSGVPGVAADAAVLRMFLAGAGARTG